MCDGTYHASLCIIADYSLARIARRRSGRCCRSSASKSNTVSRSRLQADRQRARHHTERSERQGSGRRRRGDTGQRQVSNWSSTTACRDRKRSDNSHRRQLTASVSLQHSHTPRCVSKLEPEVEFHRQVVPFRFSNFVLEAQISAPDQDLSSRILDARIDSEVPQGAK